MNAKGFRHVCQRCQQFSALIGQPVQEEHVELQHVKAVVLKNVQRRIAAAEIIKPDGKPCLLKHMEDTAEHIGVFQHQAFRNLQLDGRVRDMILLQNRVDFSEHILILEMLPGEIDGERLDRRTSPGKLLIGRAGLPQHFHVQLTDQPAFFQHGNKVRGDNHPHFGVNPSCQ